MNDIYSYLQSNISIVDNKSLSKKLIIKNNNFNKWIENITKSNIKDINSIFYSILFENILWWNDVPRRIEFSGTGYTKRDILGINDNGLSKIQELNNYVITNDSQVSLNNKYLSQRAYMIFFCSFEVAKDLVKCMQTDDKFSLSIFYSDKKLQFYNRGFLNDRYFDLNNAERICLTSKEDECVTYEYIDHEYRDDGILNRVMNYDGSEDTLKYFSCTLVCKDPSCGFDTLCEKIIASISKKTKDEIKKNINDVFSQYIIDYKDYIDYNKKLLTYFEDIIPYTLSTNKQDPILTTRFVLEHLELFQFYFETYTDPIKIKTMTDKFINKYNKFGNNPVKQLQLKVKKTLKAIQSHGERYFSNMNDENRETFKKVLNDGILYIKTIMVKYKALKLNE
jgi:hypothetical protein